MACERHQLTNEASAKRVFDYIPAALADLLRRFEGLDRQLKKITDRLPV
jgi:hypothetical protein